MPVNFSQSMDENVVALRWEHPTERLVSHYLLTVDAEGLRNQTIRVDAQELLIPQISGLEYTYSGTIMAVSVCNTTSGLLRFNGKLLFQRAGIGGFHYC